MAKHVFVVVTNPTPGKEKEYNDWYTNVHLGEVCAVEGITSAQRFNYNTGDNLAGPYLALYEMETDNPSGVIAALQKAAESGNMQMSDALDQKKISTTVFTQITDKVFSK